MNYKKIIIGLIGFSTLFYSCADWLDRDPLDLVTEAAYFKTPADFTVFVNNFYNQMGNWWSTSEALRDDESDIQFTSTSAPMRIAGRATITSGPGYSYGNVRAANYVIQKGKEYAGSFDDIKQAIGEAHFFRAIFYFNLLRNFGDVQWIGKVLTMESPELYGTRDSRKFVAEQIIADLDTAIMYLKTDKGDGASRIHKWEALYWQSRIALYEGTWEKYHAGTVFAAKEADANKFLTKAASAAKQIMDSGLYSIWSSGDTENDFYYNFNWRDFTSHPEWIRWAKMDLKQEINSHRYLYIQAYANSRSASKFLIDQFLCKDGLPISTSPLYLGDNTIEDEAANRDPRFKGTIFTKSAPWRVEEGKDTIFYEFVFNEYLFTNVQNSNGTGYQWRKRYYEVYKYHDSQYEDTPVPHYRYAEPLLNYAEARAELEQLTQADLDATINKLRDRVGMPHLELNNVPADPKARYPELPPIINEIRRERLCELAGEGVRWDDLMRWAGMSKVVGKRYVGAKNAQFVNDPRMSVNSDGYIDMYMATFPNGFQFKLDRDYLWPIPVGQITLNPNLGQNPNWGTK